jgi:hypothetical protein
VRGAVIDQGGSEAAFRSLLTPGERILWTGQPGRGVRFRRQDWATIPFGIVFILIAIFWEHGAFQSLRDGGSDPFAYLFPLFGLVIFGTVAYRLVGRFFVDAYRRARTNYAITTERILILERVGGRERLRAESIAAVDDTSVRRRSDGSGSIIIGAEPEWTEAFMNRGWNTPRPFSLEYLPDIDRVLDLLRRQQVALRSRR